MFIKIPQGGIQNFIKTLLALGGVGLVKLLLYTHPIESLLKFRQKTPPLCTLCLRARFCPAVVYAVPCRVSPEPRHIPFYSWKAFLVCSRRVDRELKNTFQGLGLARGLE